MKSFLPFGESAEYAAAVTVLSLRVQYPETAAAAASRARQTFLLGMPTNADAVAYFSICSLLPLSL